MAAATRFVLGKWDGLREWGCGSNHWAGASTGATAHDAPTLKNRGGCIATCASQKSTAMPLKLYAFPLSQVCGGARLP
jgi:hypothetical protein